jgi:hypothetical protein
MGIWQGKPNKCDTGANSHEEYRVKNFSFQAIIANDLNK